MAWHPVAVTQENSSPPTSSPQISSTDEATIDAVAVRDLVDVPAVEVVMTLAVHLMTAAAVRCGLADDPEASHQVDLAEAGRGVGQPEQPRGGAVTGGMEERADLLAGQGPGGILGRDR